MTTDRDPNRDTTAPPGADPYVNAHACSVCRARFMVFGNLVRHERDEHGITAETAEPEPKA